MADVLTVVAKVRAAKGKGDALAALLKEQVAAVRKAEPGCLVYRPHRSTKDPDLFLFYEQYRDEAAFDTHRKAPHLAAYRERRAREGLTEGGAAVEIDPSSAVSTAWPASSSSRRRLSRASALSSTTSTRRRTGAARTAAGAEAPCPAASARAGSRTVNSLPRPAPALRHDTEPPCSSTSRLTSVRPSPSPPCERSRACGSCTKRSNTPGSSSSRMPWPVSCTRSTASAPARSAVSVTRPPAGVCLSALSTRLPITCSRRPGPPWPSTAPP